MPLPSARIFVLTASVFCAARAFAAPVVTVLPEKASGVFQVNEKIVWDVKVSGDEAATVTDASYVLKEGGATVIGQGTLKFNGGVATIEKTLNEPGTILAEVTVPVPGQKNIRALGGAAIAPERIGRSTPCPEDFDAFWRSKLEELKAVPENPVLEKGESDRPGVDYWKIRMDNIRGTHIQGQLARPANGKKAPAMLLVQWAGVYPLQQKWVTERAAEGWLVLNIEAHDLPIDAPQSFYDEQKQGPLNEYTLIGMEDRERSYFVRMFMACYRSVDYLSERPDWDGRTLLVTGASQGGLQSFVSAGLNPKVTEIMVAIPAGCDHGGALAGRKPGWPYRMAQVDPSKMAQIKTFGYFDGVNFAARIKCPALIGLGLIDETSPPSGVYTAINQLQGPKEVLTLVNSDHQGTGKSQAPYNTRASQSRAALLATGVPDIKSNAPGDNTRARP